MSYLRVYWPADVGLVDNSSSFDRSPAVGDFRRRRSRWLAGRQSAVNRARILRENCRCPECGRPSVEPIELNDGRRDRGGQVVPGSATIVGFRCLRCESEWSAQTTQLSLYVEADDLADVA